MLVLIATIIVVAKMAFGTEYVVGDENGWKPNFNYSDWTKDKMFMVVFNYNSLVHDVYKVNGSDFNDCIARPGSEVLRSGNDVVTLNTTGNKWYLCSKSNHCDLGQKLKISVMDMMSSSSTTPPHHHPHNLFLGLLLLSSLTIFILLSYGAI
uniref:Phytocyanin domain-containing protein n=1 Tax=Cannabis sativa TaxID=3483 RepID=A0A803Q3X5_CANSA